ncbi:ubiquinone anaerobic biosynthesis protein UbiV [Sulfuriferula multivorans]|nr:U32 family peptidase [Sulfuriferula multivorans]
MMKLALGPVLYYWARDTLLDFYQEIAATPVDIVYLGETVCSRRHNLRLQDWLDVAAKLTAAGKQVVLSTQVLIESESDLKSLRNIADNGSFMVEANDMGAVHLLAGKMPFVAGPHLNVYNDRSLSLLATLGAQRWVMPPEMSGAMLAPIQRMRPAGMETEVFVYGRLPLAFSARCFTARAHNLPKDDCQFRCLDYPNGLSMRTREDQPFLVLNGIQTQSARTYNLIGELDTLRSMGVDVLRISPQIAHSAKIISLFRTCMDQPCTPHSALLQMDKLMPDGMCDGYWRGSAGLEQSHISSKT